MKKLLYGLVAGAMLSSCDVSVENPNTMTSETFWKTEADAEKGVNAIYNMFYKPGTYTRWMWFRLDLTSDEGTSISPWAELREWVEFKYNNYNFWEGNSWTYRDCYEAIFRANQVIDKVPEITFNDQANKDAQLGQAYFLRGFYNYHLGLLWGSSNRSLAIMTKPSTPSEQPIGHTGDEVFEQAISDLSEAIRMLPESWEGDNKGRATRGAAYAYRAKLYMQMHMWDLAKADLEWLVKGEGAKYYGLVDNYQDNFRYDTENNKESVFEIQYSEIHKAPAGDGDFDVDPNLGQNRGQFFAPPGIGWTDGEIRSWIVDEFKKERDKDGNYDIRLKYSAFYEGMDKDFEGNSRIYRYDLNGAEANIWNEQNWKGRVFYRKYSSEHFRDFDDYHNPTNVRLIRYADILLMYAETLVNISDGNLSEAAGYINQVRSRVNMPNIEVNHPQVLTNSSAFLKRLQMERALELSTEGHRWADIKRWGLLDSNEGLEELRSRDADFNNFVIGRHACLPIPSSEVQNNPNITQNPMY